MRLGSFASNHSRAPSLNQLVFPDSLTTQSNTSLVEMQHQASTNPFSPSPSNDSRKKFEEKKDDDDEEDRDDVSDEDDFLLPKMNKNRINIPTNHYLSSSSIPSSSQPLAPPPASQPPRISDSDLDFPVPDPKLSNSLPINIDSMSIKLIDRKSKFMEYESIKYTNKRNKIPEYLQNPTVIVHNKSVKEFTNPVLIQDIECQEGSINVMKFSRDGMYLACGSNNSILTVWKVIDRTRKRSTNNKTKNNINNSNINLIEEIPFRNYVGHRSTIIDISWSKNYFIITASLDNTIRLWHLSKTECVYVFPNSNLVNCICFHPSDNNYFLSGGSDNYLKIWKLPEGEVIHKILTPNIITSAAFSPTGRFCIVGLINGKMIFYTCDNLMYYTEIDCRNRNGNYSDGREIISMKFCNTENGYEILVSNTDNRIRLYKISDFSLEWKYKGHICSNNLINNNMNNGGNKINGGNFDKNSEHIISASEDGFVYIWRRMNEFNEKSILNVFGKKKNSNKSYEKFKVVKMNERLNVSIFAPINTIKKYNEDLIHKIKLYDKNLKKAVECDVGNIILIGSDKGHIRIYVQNSDPVILYK